MKTYKSFVTEASLWDYFYKTNKAIFYRGQSSSGKGMGIGMLGLGIYLTWSESMAKQFASKQTKGVVQTFKVKKGLKMVDNNSKAFAEAKANMGLKPWEWSHSKEWSGFFAGELKQMGFDGAYSDNPAEGIVIFDKKNVKEIK
jgi:hypothetical protein